jgi:hypothetical protein
MTCISCFARGCERDWNQPKCGCECHKPVEAPVLFTPEMFGQAIEAMGKVIDALQALPLAQMRAALAFSVDVAKTSENPALRGHLVNSLDEVAGVAFALGVLRHAQVQLAAFGRDYNRSKAGGN